MRRSLAEEPDSRGGVGPGQWARAASGFPRCHGGEPFGFAQGRLFDYIPLVPRCIPLRMTVAFFRIIPTTLHSCGSAPLPASAPAQRAPGAPAPVAQDDIFFVA